MRDKYEIANALRETSRLLTLKGENAYKAKAYLNGARSIENTPDDIADLVEEKSLTKLPGIGESLAAYVTELYNTGEPKLLLKLREELPPGAGELSQIDGLTLKRIQVLYDELGVQSISDLENACKSGAVAKVKGFNLKSQNTLLQSLGQQRIEQNQTLLVHARSFAEGLVKFIRAFIKSEKVEVAGEIRRWHEAVSEVVIVAESTLNVLESCMKKFHGIIVQETANDCISGILPNGTRVKIYAVPSLALGLVAYTGSPEHFAKMQDLAESKKMHLSAQALKNGKTRSDFASEEDVFKALRINFIPPELREGADEVEKASADDFSDLLELEDIQGMTHCHSTYSDGVHSIEQMARAAKKMGMEYITLTDHSPTAHYAGGVEPDRLKKQWEEIDRVQEEVGIKILKGTECDILADGALDYPDNILEQFDIIIASIHSRYRQDEKAMTKRLLNGLRNPHFKIWGHPLGRLVLKRDPIPCDVPKLLEAIADANVAIEINGDPHRLDLAPNWARLAKELGLKFVISTDAHSTSDLLNLEYGVRMARRAGITATQVLNTLPVAKFKQAVKVLR